jgi:hypothetical protein
LWSPQAKHFFWVFLFNGMRDNGIPDEIARFDRNSTRVLESKSNFMVVYFYTEFMVTKDGFRLNFESVDSRDRE